MTVFHVNLFLCTDKNDRKIKDTSCSYISWKDLPQK